MLIFYTQLKNPNEKDKKDFLKVKKKMGNTFQKIQKEKNKLGKERILMKAGDTWLAIHQFANN